MKKKLSMLMVALMTILSSFSQTGESGKKDSVDQEKKIKDMPEITFEKTLHDYGNIPKGGNGTYEFVFKNTGKEPLVLNNCQTSCGCTVTTCPKEPFKKGSKGTISVKYDTNKTGSFTKSISIYSNARNSPVTLIIKGNVSQQDNSVPSPLTTPTKQKDDKK